MTNLVDACESCRFVNFEYPILTMDFRPFHALRTWKVHVFIYSFHQATHFHTLVTPLEFWYVNTRFDFQYTMLLIFRHCLPPSTSGMLTDDLTSGVSICQWPYTNRVYWTCMSTFILQTFPPEFIFSNCLLGNFFKKMIMIHRKTKVHPW